ncbi:MAG: hypothetical protein KJO35_09410, partial [Gammaproteobacteria bacterium]|nr:hypothetical protein [Gammaproteobacteria bacterium]
AAAVAIGANLGTTTTVLIGAMPGPPAKKRVALAHLIFNLSIVIIAYILVLPMLGLIAWIGIKDPMFSLVAFHSLFNFLGILLFLPFIHIFARFLNRRFHRDTTRESRHLSEATPAVPDAALTAIEDETGHLVARVISQNMRAFHPSIPKPPGAYPIPYDGPVPGMQYTFDQLYRRTKRLEGEILAFAVELQTRSLDAAVSARLNQLLSAVRSAVHSAKSLRDIRHNLAEFEESPRAEVNAFLNHARDVMTKFYDEVFTLPGDVDSDIMFRDFAELLKHVHGWHDQLHREILTDISARHIDEAEISSLLNVNRGLLYSNIAIIMAIKDYHLESPQAEAFRQLPGAL